MRYLLYCSRSICWMFCSFLVVLLYSCESLELNSTLFIGETEVEIDSQTGAVVVRSFIDGIEGNENSIVSYGHIWGEEADLELPIVSDARDPFVDFTRFTVEEGELNQQTLEFQSRLRRISGNTTYSVRPFFTLSNGENVYGQAVSITTPFETFLDMVFVEGGQMVLGDSIGITPSNSDERPARLVSITDFAISKYEVTSAFYDAVMGTSKSQDCPLCPISGVSWIEAKLFLKALNERISGREFILPSEAQWEYAARGGKLKTERYFFSGSNSLEQVGWHLSNSGTAIEGIKREVGLLQPNELGIYDMTGNVIEWCEDWYNFEFYGASFDFLDPLNANDPSLRWKFGAVGSSICFFDPEISRQYFSEELGFSENELEKFFFLEGEKKVFEVPNDTLFYFSKVCRSCFYGEPNDYNFFCRISNRNPLYAPNEQREIVGFRIAEKLN